MSIDPAGTAPAVICDLDGTLIDSVGDIANALNRALTANGHGAVPRQDVANMVGAGAGMLIRRALAALHIDTANERAAERIYDAFVAAYLEAPAEQSYLYDGVAECLTGWQRAGHQLAICTNKPQAITDQIVIDMQLDQWFAASIGAQPTYARKPAGDMVQAALDALGASATHAVMIGDSAADVGAARAAGLPVVVVDFGYSPVAARELGADKVISRWAEAPAAIADLLD